MRRHKRFVYDLVRGFNARSLRANWRLDIEGAAHLNIRGPAILVFNHGHIVDGTVIMPLVQRRIRFLCDHRALRVPVLGQILSLMDVIPVHVRRPDPFAAVAAPRRAAGPTSRCLPGSRGAERGPSTGASRSSVAGQQAAGAGDTGRHVGCLGIQPAVRRLRSPPPTRHHGPCRATPLSASACAGASQVIATSG